MTITITISTENPAFEGVSGQEVSRILDKLAFQIRDWPGGSSFKLGLLDLHGNKVGECVAAPAKPERSDCIRCGDPLEGRAVALCLECQEESSKEVKDACEREDEEL